MPEKLNWNLLRMFSVLAEEGNLTGAAIRLGISQPAMTQALHRLEEQLGCTLAVRKNRSFILTATGERVLAEAKVMNACAERVSALRYPERSAQMLRLQTVTHLYSPLLDEAIRLFHLRHPTVDLRVEVQNSRDTIDNLRRDQEGIGICLLPDAPSDLEFLPICPEKFALYCGAEHRLFGQKASVELLRKENFVVFSSLRGTAQGSLTRTVCERYQLGQNISGSSQNLEEVRRMIVFGVGIGLLPLSATQEHLAKGLLWQLDGAFDTLDAEVFLVWHPDARLTDSEVKFIEVIQDVAGVDGVVAELSP